MPWWKLRVWICGVLVVAMPFAGISGAPAARAAVPPTVTAVTPAKGKTAGGATVVLTGTGFQDVTKVQFGSKAGTKLKLSSSTSLSVVAPAGTGTVDVRVVTKAGTSPTSEQAKYSYLAAPTVTKVSTTAGGIDGGTMVTLTGTNFVDFTKVTFGSTPGTKVQIKSEKSLTVTTPARKAGAVDIQVTTAYGTSKKSSKARFTFMAAPKISSVSPNAGKLTGGTTVTIKGSDFSKITRVTFGGNAGTKLKVSSTKNLTVTTPSGKAGVAEVQVAGAYGSSPKATAARFTYIAPPNVTKVAPANGPTTGGTKVTITGTDFTNVSKVAFGTKSGTKLSVTSKTSLTVVTPSQSGQTVDVRVTSSYGTSATNADARFTYGTAPAPTPAPTITSVTPTSGTTAGGTKLTITGTDLTGTSKVTIGGVDATGLTVVSATQVTLTAPAHAAGAVDIVLITPGGTVTKTGAFTYVAPAPAAPTMTSVAPTSGTTAGGTKLTITGTNLTGTSKITVGGTNVADLVVVSATQVTATSPAHAAGVVDVVLTAPGGSVTKTGAFTYTPPAPAAPTITSVAPTSGPTAGGTKLTITGTNLTGTSKVTVGGSNATDLVVVSATQVTVTSPPHAAGAVDIVLTAPGGTVTKPGAFIYAAPAPAAPTITSITPTSGTTAGGTKLTITGTNLTGTTKVTIGGTDATGIAVVSATEVTAVSPAHAAGVVDVALTTPGGTVTKTGAFTYSTPAPAAPTITSVTPATGSTAGGTKLTITGTNLTGTTKLTLGGANAGDLVVVSATQVTATSPAHAAGVVDVALTAPGGTATKTGAFTYTAPTPAAPTVTSITPVTGSTSGGTKLTITGTNLTGTSKVTVGGANVTDLIVVSATQITATTPAHAAGLVDLVLTAPGGVVTKTGAFTYVPGCAAQTIRVSGTINADTVWSASCGLVYNVTGQLTVAKGATLTVPAGVVVKFNSSTYLSVDGSLIVNGTAASPVIFTSIYWNGIGINTDAKLTTNALTQRYGGGISGSGASVLKVTNSTLTRSTSGIYASRGGSFEDRLNEITITGNTLTSSLGIEVYSTNERTDADAVPIRVSGNNVTGNSSTQPAYLIRDSRIQPSRLTGNTGTTNKINAIHLGGVLVENWTMPTSGLPYVIDYSNWSGLTVAKGATLTVPAGVVVKFNSSTYLSVDGSLIVNGTAASPVIFTSIYPRPATGTASASTPTARLAPAASPFAMRRPRSQSAVAMPRSRVTSARTRWASSPTARW